MKTITRMITAKCGACLGIGSIFVGFQAICVGCNGTGEIIMYVEEVVDDEPEETKETERGIEKISFY